MPRKLYKYRSLHNFDNFEDIIRNNRLYASSYQNLNDADEGHYYYSEDVINEVMRREIYNQKKILKICSLSQERNHPLLWGHYSDGSRGVNIVLNVNDNNIITTRNVKYEGLLEYNSQDNIPPNLKAINILTRKLPDWSYEKEKRIFTRNTYVSVVIREIILGARIAPEDERRIRTLIQEVNPNIRIVTL